ncbi:MAG TPA: hypothetical protein VK422_22545 [Pyrinomonadaceae bacterium]|nr:hypothetical protein [Pyrinomonadaceae bacterium]
MSSERYARIKIGELWLTADGTADGYPCRATVENEAAFASPFAVSHTQALDFTVHTQIAERGLTGIGFAVLLEYCPESLLDDLVEALETALGEGSGLRVVVESLTNFDVLALPVFQGQQLFTWVSRSGGIAKTVRVNFISTGPGGA